MNVDDNDDGNHVDDDYDGYQGRPPTFSTSTFLSGSGMATIPARPSVPGISTLAKRVRFSQLRTVVETLAYIQISHPIDNTVPQSDNRTNSGLDLHR